jgi:ribulose-phosphate 3-epimerase
LENAHEILQAGADVLVAGSSIFKSKNPIETIARMKSL